jgi:hypothetical protein
MPCLFVLVALAMPRGVVAALWLFTGWFQGVFESVMWPLLGFVFLPSTLLWYTAVQHWFGGEWGFWPVVGLVAALMIDVSPARRSKRG